MSLPARLLPYAPLLALVFSDGYRFFLEQFEVGSRVRTVAYTEDVRR
jgi:hypothetical protein